MPKSKKTTSLNRGAKYSDYIPMGYHRVVRNGHAIDVPDEDNPFFAIATGKMTAGSSVVNPRGESLRVFRQIHEQELVLAGPTDISLSPRLDGSAVAVHSDQLVPGVTHSFKWDNELIFEFASDPLDASGLFDIVPREHGGFIVEPGTAIDPSASLALPGIDQFGEVTVARKLPSVGVLAHPLRIESLAAGAGLNISVRMRVVDASNFYPSEWAATLDLLDVAGATITQTDLPFGAVTGNEIRFSGPEPPAAWTDVSYFAVKLRQLTSSAKSSFVTTSFQLAIAPDTTAGGNQYSVPTHTQYFGFTNDNFAVSDAMQGRGGATGEVALLGMWIWINQGTGANANSMMYGYARRSGTAEAETIGLSELKTLGATRVKGPLGIIGFPECRDMSRFGTPYPRHRLHEDWDRVYIDIDPILYAGTEGLNVYVQYGAWYGVVSNSPEVPVVERPIQTQELIEYFQIRSNLSTIFENKNHLKQIGKELKRVVDAGSRYAPAAMKAIEMLGGTDALYGAAEGIAGGLLALL